MSEEKKTVATEEVKEARKLTEEELEQVTGGGSATLEVASEVARAIFGAERMDIDATEALQGKFAGVVISSAGQTGSEMRLGVR